MANDDGFLSRWSRRKQDVREGRPLDEPLVPPASSTAPVVVESTSRRDESGLPADVSANPVSPASPTLADAQQLTSESDFSQFMSPEVLPDVKNAAMKKLFTDPHFNVMDRMDVYIDDYSQSDPLPVAMLRQMVSAKTLNLFDQESSEPSQAEMDRLPPSTNATQLSPDNPEGTETNA